MKLNTKSMIVIALSGAVALSMTACKKSSGGGFIPLESGSKATFGYQAKCENIAYPVDSTNPELFVAQITGQFQFKDHDQKVSFHGNINSIPYEEDNEFTSCEAIDQLVNSGGEIQAFSKSMYFSGTYQPQPKKAGDGGTFTALVSDEESSANTVLCDGNSDFISLEIESGVYSGYSAQGCLEGGNITTF